jgi:hypothetical protein
MLECQVARMVEDSTSGFGQCRPGLVRLSGVNNDDWTDTSVPLIVT